MKKKKQVADDYTEKELDIVDAERSKYPKEIYDMLHRYGLSKEEERELVDKLHEDLVYMMDRKYLNDYLDTQAKKYAAYERASVLDAISGASFGLSTALNATLLSMAVTPIGMLCTALCGAFALKGIVKAIYNKVQVRRITKKVQKIIGGWAYVATESTSEVLDFYKANNLQPRLDPFSPLQLEGVYDARKNKDELVPSVTHERLDEILKQYKAEHQSEEVEQE